MTPESVAAVRSVFWWFRFWAARRSRAGFCLTLFEGELSRNWKLSFLCFVVFPCLAFVKFVISRSFTRVFAPFFGWLKEVCCPFRLSAFRWLSRILFILRFVRRYQLAMDSTFISRFGRRYQLAMDSTFPNVVA